MILKCFWCLANLLENDEEIPTISVSSEFDATTQYEGTYCCNKHTLEMFKKLEAKGASQIILR